MNLSSALRNSLRDAMQTFQIPALLIGPEGSWACRALRTHLGLPAGLPITAETLPKAGAAKSWRRTLVKMRWTALDGKPAGADSMGAQTELLLPDGQTLTLCTMPAPNPQMIFSLLAYWAAQICTEEPYSERAFWLRALIDTLPAQITWRDGELTLLGCNRAASDAGLGSAQYLNWDALATDLAKNMLEVLETGQEKLACFGYERQRGQICWTQYSLLPVFPRRSSVREQRRVSILVYCCLIADEAGWRHTPEAERILNHHTHKNVLDASGLIAFRAETGERLRFTYIGESVRRLGYVPLRLLQSRAGLLDLLPGEDREAFQQFIDQKKDFRESYSIFFSAHRADGSIVPMEMDISLREDENGLFISGLMRDLTEEEELQQVILEESRSLRERLEQILGERICSRDNELPVLDFIDRQSLQRRQDTLARLHKLSAVLAGQDGAPLTEVSGSGSPMAVLYPEGIPPWETARLNEYGAPEFRVLPDGRTGIALPLRLEGHPLGIWLLLTDGANSAADAARDFAQLARDTARIAKVEAHLLQQRNESRIIRSRLRDNVRRQRLIALCYFLMQDLEKDEDTVLRVLGFLGRELNISRLYVYEEKAGALYLTHQWAMEGMRPLGPEDGLLPDSETASYTADLAGRLISFSLLHPGSPERQAYLQRNGTHASSRMPVFIDGTLKAVLGMDKCMRGFLSMDDETDFYEHIFKLISNVVLRGSIITQLETTQRSLRVVLETLELGVLYYEENSNQVLDMNSSFRALLPGVLQDRREAGPLLNWIDEDGALLREGGSLPLETYRGKQSFLCTMFRANWQSIPAIVVTAVDITEQKRKNRIVADIVLRDPLLGIHNRRRFEADLNRVLNGTRRGLTRGALVLMDLDDFKYVNDTFGYSVGDRILRAAADTFESRPETKGRLYRLGGDELLLLLSGPEQADLTAVVEDTWARFQKPIEVDGVSHLITVSMGVARFPEDGTSAEEVLRRADMALDKAKSEGKNAAVFYHEGLAGGLTARIEMERRLLSAAEDGFSRFRLLYQPVIDLKSGAVCGAEALLRLEDETGKLRPAAEFVEILESMGLMRPVGGWVLKTALAEMHERMTPGFTLSVNLSGRQLRDESLAEQIDTALTLRAVRPECLALEVTESAAGYDAETRRPMLQRLRALGCKVFLDGYGTQTGAMTRLSQIPCDGVTLDGQFIRSMADDPFYDTVVQTSIELALAAGLLIRAEGVETQEQYLDLCEYGCEQAMGNYFSPPASAAPDWPQRFV